MRRSRGDRRWVVVAVLVAAAVEVMLRASTLPRTARRLRLQLGADGPAGPFHSAPLAHWTRPRLRAVERVSSRWPWGDTCLRRSLLTAVLLRPLGPVVRLGWLPTPEGGNAHAWVEVAGRSLDSGLDGVVPFATR